MPQSSTSGAYEYSRSLSIAHKRRLVGTHRSPQRITSSDTESDDMKVDSPSTGMNKALVFGEHAIDSDDDYDDDVSQEPPYKRICRDRQSALSLALRESSGSSFAKPVVVRVGPSTSAEEFHIHETRLAQSSPFFEAAFEKLHQQEPPADILELTEDDPVVFQLYAQYIYNPSSIAELDLATETRSDLSDAYVDLLQAYIFGEKVQNSDFQNEVMNRILRCMRDMHKPPNGGPRSLSSSEHIVRPLVELLYPSLPPDSIGRGLAVETFIVLWSHSDRMQTFVPDLSRELLTEIAEMLLSGDKDHIRDAWAQAINGDYSYYHSARSDEH